VVRVTIEEFDS